MLLPFAQLVPAACQLVATVPLGCPGVQGAAIAGARHESELGASITSTHRTKGRPPMSRATCVPLITVCPTRCSHPAGVPAWFMPLSMCTVAQVVLMHALVNGRATLLPRAMDGVIGNEQLMQEPNMMERVRYEVGTWLGEGGLLDGAAATTSRSRSISMSAEAEGFDDTDFCGLARSLGCDEGDLDELGCPVN